MHPVASEIAGRLADVGWFVEQRHEPLHWWADETWHLRSVWSPTDSTAVLTFLVDPQAHLANRKKGDEIWAVKASATDPEDWAARADEVVLDLGKHWVERLPDFLAQISRFRTGRANQRTVATPVAPAENREPRSQA